MTKKKQQLIETALSLFLRYGYSQISMDKICQEANVAKMTAYKYFPSKELLFEAALAKRSEDFIAGLRSATAQHKIAIDKLKAVFLYHHDWFVQDDFNGCLFINSIALFAEGNQNIQALARHNKTMTNDLIANLLKTIVATDDVAVLTAQISKLLDGAIISAQLGNEENPAHNAWSATVALLKNKHINVGL